MSTRIEELSRIFNLYIEGGDETGRHTTKASNDGKRRKYLYVRRKRGALFSGNKRRNRQVHGYFL